MWISFFSEIVMSKFAQRVDIAVDALSSNPPKDVDDNDFIDASRLVYDGVREIRRAVLMNRVSDCFVVSLVSLLDFCLVFFFSLSTICLHFQNSNHSINLL